MYFIVVYMLAVIPLISSQAPQGQQAPEDLFFRNFCPDGSQKCRTSVQRCLGSPTAQAQQNAQNAGAQYKQCFIEHGVQLAQASNTGNPEADLQNNVQLTLVGLTDPSIISEVRCCIGRAIGVLDVNDHINLVNYKNDVTKNYKGDPAVALAYIQAAGTCQPNVQNCEAEKFSECTFHYCVRILNNEKQ